MKNTIRHFLFGTSLNDNKVLNTGWLLFRLHIGLSLAIHAGWPKMNNLSAPAWFNEQVAGLGFTFPSPAFWAILASWGEFVGGICIALGLLTRFSALQLAFQFFVISFLWYEEPEPVTGMYFQQTLFWGYVLVVFTGGGRYSLDKMIMNRRKIRLGQSLKTSLAALLLLVALNSSAQKGPLNGSGIIVIKTFDYKDFDKLEIRNLSGKIAVELGKPHSITVAVDNNLEKLLQVSANNGELLMELEGNENNKLYIERTNINIKITMPAVTEVRHHSNSDMLITGFTGRSFRVKSSSNGDMQLKGKLDELDISKSGNGNLKADEVVATTVKVNKSGNGDVYINTSNSFSANGSGNGDVVNIGEGIPANTSGIDGNGEIRYKNQPVQAQVSSKRVQVRIRNETGLRVELTVKYPGKGSYGIEVGAFGSAKENVPAGTKIFKGGQVTVLKKPLYEVTENDKQTYIITQ
jgi:uncharacterized membrane protein YphA (DoxX/SURF4 family)